MTITESFVDDWLVSLSDGDLGQRRRAAEQRLARSQQVLARLNMDQRKIETRRKIVLGAAVLTAARGDSEFRDRLHAVLNEAVTAPRDRALLGLAPLLAGAGDNGGANA
ncbi:hypothetical protein [Azospirillum griseum]|uniref:Mobilization protein n=1 Tax=Azospirillum griseum TaxID=2496639 RepID=A0A3S0K762_9PROT|nr:hypothetical protein [Azospirillum griseum]RTR23051.1 hypothetical protein EJ903_05660 [Azospirillum griseum]